MPLQIRLLGSPAIIDADGDMKSLRGHQAWALLARLLLSKRCLDRRMLAGELFPDVADPLGALRWCLGSIRKALHLPDSLRGDPISLNLPKDIEVDVLSLQRPDFIIDDVGGFLEGIEPRCSLELSTWLLVERERIASAIEERLREQTFNALAKGDSRSAILLAELGVRRRPFDESAHILLVKSLTEAGRHTIACKHIENVEKTFRAELGESPSAALRSAARVKTAAPPAGIRSEAVVLSLMESGLAALAAGTIDAGIDCLRRSVASAERITSKHLSATATLELGTALVHSIRGFDDEGTILLRQAADLADECGDRTIAARAYSELGYVEALAGRRPTAAHILRRALEVAEDPENLSAIHAVIGFNLVDWSNLSEGLEHYEIALAHARSVGSRRREIWALGLGAWGLLAAGQLHDAETWLLACLTCIQEERWISFRPWPLAVLAEVKLRQQADPASLRPRLEEAFALSCQIGDPCWEGASARSMALTYMATDEWALAGHWLSEARTRCVRETDRYAALLVAIVADQMNLSMRSGKAGQTDALARELLQLASRAHMPGHVRMAHESIGR